MGLFSSSWERQVDNNLFDFIDIDSFKNFRFTTLFNYFLMISLLLLKLFLLGTDIYTCIRLLAFDEWSSMVKPYLSFRISKWLFSACIICSVVLLIFDTLRGVRVYRSRNISLIYTNNFARRAKSLRNYKFFCVLNEINPVGGFDKLAFYVYFQYHGSKRLIYADSPRQVINALTLYSVLNIQNGFWHTITTISTTNRNEALILYSMTISFFIWLVFMAQFIFAVGITVPVFYRILHKERYQSIRQYVCIKVDHSVKKLSKEHQKKSLKKMALSNKKLQAPTLPHLLEKSYASTDSLVESTASIPRPTARVGASGAVRAPHRVLSRPELAYSTDSLSKAPVTRYEVLEKQAPQVPQVPASLLDEESMIGTLDSIEMCEPRLPDHSDSELDELELDDLASNLSFESTKPMKPRDSLVLRAREMDSEDYSRFRPMEFIPERV